MSRSLELFVRDMLEACEKISRYTVGLTFEDFVNREMVYDAVLRNLGVLGEAAETVPEDYRNAHPEVDWKGIAGLRDVLAHAYFALDDATLWDIVVRKVPEWSALLRGLLEGEGRA